MCTGINHVTYWNIKLLNPATDLEAMYNCY